MPRARPTFYAPPPIGLTPYARSALLTGAAVPGYVAKRSMVDACKVLCGRCNAGEALDRWGEHPTADGPAACPAWAVWRRLVE